MLNFHFIMKSCHFKVFHMGEKSAHGKDEDERETNSSCHFLILLLMRQMPTNTMLHWIFLVWPQTLLLASPFHFLIQGGIFLWYDCIPEPQCNLIKSLFTDRSVLSENQIFIPLSNVGKFTVGFTHWNRVCGNHRSRIFLSSPSKPSSSRSLSNEMFLSW